MASGRRRKRKSWLSSRALTARSEPRKLRGHHTQFANLRTRRAHLRLRKLRGQHTQFTNFGRPTRCAVATVPAELGVTAGLATFWYWDLYSGLSVAGGGVLLGLVFLLLALGQRRQQKVRADLLEEQIQEVQDRLDSLHNQEDELF